jgi:presequence protease
MSDKFNLIKTKTVTEINAETFLYEHIKTGARLFYIKNDDPNKVFDIAFRTPPEDDTGCPHILEHSVLNGSKHFPAKNTFTELCKGSVKTFLNAFTMADLTSYPIASTNDKDFMNLMHVYLDAVLYPNIYNSPDILKQEGWHHELLKPGAEIIYKGVVYNEMKGAFSSPETIMSKKITHIQNPDTPYRFESGGDPEIIPQLTWERFKAFHQRYYHPSNCWIILYGDLDIVQTLEFIDTNYLSHFDKINPGSDLPWQQPFSVPITVEEPYSIGEEENPEGKYYLSLNFTCGDVLDIFTCSQLAILTQILMDSPASPLNRALLESDLCEESSARFNDYCRQPMLSITCKNVKQENLKPLRNFIFEHLKNLVRDGIDKKLIEGTINKNEFFLREADMRGFPKGLFYAMSALKTWLHDGDPLSNLEFEPILDELRRGLKEPLYEQLIDKYILQNPHSSTIHLEPVPGLVSKRDEQTRIILQGYKNTLNDEQIKALIEDNLKLQQWQSTPDTEEDLEKIPFISLSDIKKEAEPLFNEVEQHGKTTLLKHAVNTSGIVYLNAYFDISHLPESDLPWVKLLTDLVGNLDTANLSFAELSNEIDIHTGGIHLSLSFFNDWRDSGKVLPKLTLEGKCVLAKTEKLLQLMVEHTFKTVFTDLDRIKQLITELKAHSHMRVINAGSVIATRRMLAQDNLYNHWLDLTQGMEFYRYLLEVEKQLAENPTAVSGKLAAMLRQVFTKDNLIISITSSETDIGQVWHKIGMLTDEIRQENLPEVEYKVEPNKINEGIFAPVNVQYCAQGGNYSQLGYAYSGKMEVLENILSNDFLMQEIRVKGGAYGIMVNFSRFGYLSFCSYRDPNLAGTLAVYGKVYDYLKNFHCTSHEFEKYIIGTVASLDMPQTPSQKGTNGDYYHITGLDFADKQKLRDEVLSTTIEDIRQYANMIAEVMKKKQYAVFGVEANLKEHSGLFDVILPAIPA